MAKHLLGASDTDPDAIDWRFIERYTAGFESCQLQLLSKAFSQTRAQPSQLPIFSGLVRRRRLLELPE